MFAKSKSNTITEQLKLEKILKQLETAYSQRWFTIAPVDADAIVVGKVEQV